MGREFFEQCLRRRCAGRADTVGSTRGEAACARRIATEGALRGVEFLQFVRGQKVDLAVMFDVAAVAGDGGTDLTFIGTAGFEGDRKIETVAGLDGVADNLGFAKVGGILFEVWRELGVEVFAQAGSVSGEKVERLVPIAEPPTSRGWIERETSGFEQLEGGRV